MSFIPCSALIINLSSVVEYLFSLTGFCGFFPVTASVDQSEMLVWLLPLSAQDISDRMCPHVGFGASETLIQLILFTEASWHPHTVQPTQIPREEKLKAECRLCKERNQLCHPSHALYSTCLLKIITGWAFYTQNSEIQSIKKKTTWCHTGKMSHILWWVT